MNYYRNTTLTAAANAQDEAERSCRFREWLDTFYLNDDEKRIEMLEEEPPLCTPHWDAIFAAAVSWLAHKMNRSAPEWTRKNCRRLHSPYRIRKDPCSVAASYDRDRAPAEFFNRNLYIGPEILFRARMPLEWIPKPKNWEIKLAKYLQKKRKKDHPNQ